VCFDIFPGFKDIGKPAMLKVLKHISGVLAFYITDPV
jgi:hypothetical protein